MGVQGLLLAQKEHSVLWTRSLLFHGDDWLAVRESQGEGQLWPQGTAQESPRVRGTGLAEVGTFQVTREHCHGFFTMGTPNPMLEPQDQGLSGGSAFFFFFF